MIDTIRGLLAGSITRAQAKAWTRELWPEGSGQGDPFRAAELESVFDSLWNIDERDDDGDVIRDSDLRAYLDWLTRGESFLGDKDPLVVLAIDRDTFAAQVGCTPVRFCVEGRSGARTTTPTGSRSTDSTALRRPTRWSGCSPLGGTDSSTGSSQRAERTPALGLLARHQDRCTRRSREAVCGEPVFQWRSVTAATLHRGRRASSGAGVSDVRTILGAMKSPMITSDPTLFGI